MRTPRRVQSHALTSVHRTCSPPCPSSVDCGNTEIPSMHRGLGSATVSQLAFSGESKPNFPWEKSQWDSTVVKKKKKHVSQSQCCVFSQLNTTNDDLILCRQSHSTTPFCCLMRLHFLGFCLKSPTLCMIGRVGMPRFKCDCTVVTVGRARFQNVTALFATVGRVRFQNVTAML